MIALLLAEDRDNIAIFSVILQQAGCTVSTAKTLSNTIKVWGEHPADLILLASAQRSPLEQIHQLGNLAQVPLILFIQRLTPELECTLLDAGADLVIGPEFNPKLVIARIKALMRRAKQNPPSVNLKTLTFNDFTLDAGARTIVVQGKEKQRLTHLEFKLLYTLMTNRGQVLPTDTIVEQVWGFTDQGDRDLVRGLISRLRNKVEPTPREPRYIITVPGVGYIFEDQPYPDDTFQPAT